MHRLRIPALLLALFFLLTAALAEPALDEELAERFGGGLTIDYGGKTWKLRSRLETILVMGTDERPSQLDEPGAYDRHRNGGQADFLLLIVIDDNARTITPIEINRETMADFVALGIMGDVVGTTHGQICLSHSYGDGREESAGYVVDAVRGLLHGIPIDHYYSLNMAGISVFNDAIGGVTVTIEDDMSMYDPAMTAGTTLKLKGIQAQYFCRSRFDIGDTTNVSRMSRQRAYIKAVQPILMEIADTNPNSLNTIYEQLQGYSVTDLSKGRVVNLGAKVSKYEVLPIVSIAGETVLNERSGWYEFYADEQDILRILSETMFEPA